MPLRWHVNLPGPVAYSRPIRKKRKGSGPLTTILIWFTVKPLELMFRGMASLFRRRKPVAQTLAPLPSAYAAPGWYQTQYGPLWFNGRVWVRPDGRPF